MLATVLLCCWCDRRRQRNFDVVQDAVVGSCKLQSSCSTGQGFDLVIAVALNRDDMELQPVAVPFAGNYGGESAADVYAHAPAGRRSTS